MNTAILTTGPRTATTVADVPTSLDIVQMFAGHPIRILGTPDDPLFVAKDVCEVLEIANSRDAVSSLDPDELVSVKATSGGQLRSLQAVTESGLYTLIFKSRKDEAKKFRKWVTSEVIPAIRKTGSYGVPVALPSYPEALRLYAAEIEKTAMLETAVSELTPKADALDRIADADGQLNITQAAKVLQVSPKWLFSYLNVNGWTYRCQSTGAWVPYQGRIKSGVMSARVHTLTNQTTGEEMLKHQAYITPKGIAALSKFISTPSAQ